jgi:precorrin-8X/cobalt-precorrin-8 methylmutase
MNDPQGIEKGSFEIIAEELGDKINNFSPEELPIIQRVIHTTADFEYADLIEFHPEAIKKGKEALMAGKNIYADTMMIRAGINKRNLNKLGCEIVNFVHDEDVREEAMARGVTRSTVAMEKAVRDENIGIYAIGNAPTALFKLIELIKEGKADPDLILAIPVGFVGAAESKEAVLEAGKPYIRVKGRKGGSSVVASVINAMVYQIGREW